MGGMFEKNKSKIQFTIRHSNETLAFDFIYMGGGVSLFNLNLIYLGVVKKYIWWGMGIKKPY
jgi:hypothetical protein